MHSTWNVWPQRPELAADRVGHSAADADVHLVEDQGLPGLVERR